MSLVINPSKIATLCPEECRKFAEAYGKFTDREWTTESGMTIAESLKFICDRVADGTEPDDKLNADLADAIKGVIKALDRKGVHGVVPAAFVNLEMKGVTIRFTIPEATVFSKVLTEEGKRILKALDATEADFTDTD